MKRDSFTGYVLSGGELRAVQLVELELLCEVDRICRKCGIAYHIVAGTLLGAVRHGGFIPWDDDADVAFLRGEYERFRLACLVELDGSRFYFQDHRNTPGYRWGYGKLRRRGTEFVRLNQEHMPYEQGVFIDMFPYDYVPDNVFLRQLHCFKCFLFRKAFWSPVGLGVSRGPGWLVYFVLSKVSDRWLYRGYERFVVCSNRRVSGWIRILTFPTPTWDHGYRRSWAESSSEFVFEGVSFFGAAEFDEYLSFKYGDYLCLPPVGERKTHPISSLRLLDEVFGDDEEFRA